MRILIAAHDVPVASFVSKELEAEHYPVDISADGERARAMAAEYDYDLVILDLNLPRLDGIAILRNVRTRKTAPAGPCAYRAEPDGRPRPMPRHGSR